MLYASTLLLLSHTSSASHLWLNIPYIFTRWYTTLALIVTLGFSLVSCIILLYKIFAKHITHSVCLFVSLLVCLQQNCKTTAWTVMNFLGSIRTVTRMKWFKFGHDRGKILDVGADWVLYFAKILQSLHSARLWYQSYQSPISGLPQYFFSIFLLGNVHNCFSLGTVSHASQSVVDSLHLHL